MTFTTIFPVALVALLAIVLFAFIKMRKSPPNPKLRQGLQLFGVVCAIISMVAIVASFYFSRDVAQLYKLALPGCIIVLIVVQMRQGKAKL
jgi:L-asparagine transporter-like permease